MNEPRASARLRGGCVLSLAESWGRTACAAFELKITKAANGVLVMTALRLPVVLPLLSGVVQLEMALAAERACSCSTSRGRTVGRAGA
jgi:hypothetical protein